jgi:hypothetical protein
MIEASRIKALPPLKTNKRSYHLLVSFGLMILAAIMLLSWLFTDESLWQVYVQVRLLPWIGLTAVVLLAPSVYLYYKKKFDIFHPLVHACWFYWFPSFVIGGLLLATDLIQPYQLSLLSDPETDLIWTYVYIILGFGGMSLGFFLPVGRYFGEFASRKLPAWDWRPRQVLLPAVAFLFVGSYFYISAFFSGTVGASTADTSDNLGTLNFTFAFLSLEAGYLAAIYLFKSRGFRVEHFIAFGVIGFLLLSRVSLSASRGTILAIVILMAMAFAYSGRRVSTTTAVVFGILTVLSVVGGMIYGTTFRYTKGSEDRTGIEKQIETVGQTLDAISTQDTEKVLTEAFTNLGERIDGVSSVAVVVANYERLKPYEASYGLENNIVTDLWTSLIPRFFWANKPAIFDARAYSDLYFNFNGNSYALTPVGDLLRNFGSIGVPLGMLFVGIFLRFVYVALIENQTVTIGRATAYYLFLVSLSYEGFYGTIFIYGWRIFLIAFISFLFAEFLLIARRQT